MAEYARVSPEGEVLEYVFFADPPENIGPLPASNKPYLLPVTRTADDLDLVTERPDDPVTTVGETEVVIHTPSRAKNTSEVDDMKAAKLAAIKDQFEARAYSAIDLDVGGVTYTFDADKDALENLNGVINMINAGMLTTSRGWKPQNSTGILMGPDDFKALLGVIAARKDSLYAVKWTLEATVLALTNPSDIAAFDPSAGWD